MEILEKIIYYLNAIGKEVENYSYKLIYNGGCWEYEVEGTSIDGEEQYFQGREDTLEELYKKIKQDM